MSRRREPNLRSRLSLLGMLMVLGCTALAVRAVDLQVLRKDFYQQQGDARFLREIPIPTSRGMIVDRNGEPLAVSVPVESIWANPRELLLHTERLPELAFALHQDADALLQRVAQRASREFVFLRRHLTPEDAERILALGIPGVHSQREFRRYYPAGEVLAQVLGFTDIDDRGQEGLELAFDEWLSGVPGAKRVIRDRRGRIVENVELVRDAVPGRTLQLSIDRRVQYLAYRELKTAIDRHGAQSGSVVLLDVTNGEVLAMVNYPSYNPNHRSAAAPGSQRNRALTDVFEPGSVIKPFVVLAALESGRFDVNSLIDTTPGRLQVGRHTVRDVNNFGVVDLTRLIAKSSNVASVRLAQQMPAEHLWDSYRRFGFGEVTGSGFPGEAPGVLPELRRWRSLETATLSFGYGMSTTALQLAQAYAAIAAEGRLRAPTFVLGARNPDQAIIDPTLARQMMQMLEAAVGPGSTGTRAVVHNYRVAGKTGTSRRAIAGGYESRYIALFAGIAPVERPRFAMVVVIHDPSAGEFFGGQVAAPVFARIASGALRLLAVPPDGIGTLHVERNQGLPGVAELAVAPLLPGWEDVP